MKKLTAVFLLAVIFMISTTSAMAGTEKVYSFQVDNETITFRFQAINPEGSFGILTLPNGSDNVLKTYNGDLAVLKQMFQDEHEDIYMITVGGGQTQISMFDGNKFTELIQCPYMAEPAIFVNNSDDGLHDDVMVIPLASQAGYFRGLIVCQNDRWTLYEDQRNTKGLFAVKTIVSKDNRVEIQHYRENRLSRITTSFLPLYGWERNFYSE